MGPQPDSPVETLIYLVRHGETTWNRERRFQGQADAPLSEVGRRQAAATSAHLAGFGLSAVYSSDLSRARDTAEAIAHAGGLPGVVTDAALREADFGAWQGMTVDEVHAAYPREAALWWADSVEYRPEGGERLEEMAARAVRFLRDLLPRREGEAIAVVSHGGPIKAMVCYTLGAPVSAFRHIRVGNCSISTLRHTPDDGNLVLLAFNDTSHLR